MKYARLPFLTACLFLAIFSGGGMARAQMRVASLHPLLSDLARQVGGDKVEITSLLKPGMEVHHFEPTTKDLVGLRGVRLVLASGKNLENYLDKLRDTLGNSTEVFEVGSTKIPTLKSPGKGADPHWWHSPIYMERAARIIADKFSELDPGSAVYYQANADAACRRLEELRSWAQVQIAAIPLQDRVLVSAHNAFGYFCKEFKFQRISILGLEAEDEASTKDIVEAIKTIRDHHVRAVFPEDQANPKILSEIGRETGAKIGAPLDADGTAEVSGGTFEGMFRHNVESIVSALK